MADCDKMWAYFNNEERQVAYFKSVEARRPIIGAWLQKGWLEKLVRTCGFREVKAVDQDPKLIYADFRYVRAKV